MNDWMVALKGDETDLSYLARDFDSSEWNIEQEEETYYLTSKAFDQLTNDNDVHSSAQHLLDAIKGALYLDLGRILNVAVGNSVHPPSSDETRGVTVFLQTLRQTSLIPGMKQRAQKSSELAFNDKIVEECLCLYAPGGSRWVKLYNILEKIGNDVVRHQIGGPHQKGPERAISENGWATQADVTLFRWTAQHKGRHGVPIGSPPPQPMPQPRAEALIGNILKSWLDTKST